MPSSHVTAQGQQTKRRHRISKGQGNTETCHLSGNKRTIFSLKAPLYDARASCDLQWHRSWREPEQLILSCWQKRAADQDTSGTILVAYPNDKVGLGLCVSKAATWKRLEVWTACGSTESPRQQTELLGRRSAQQKRRDSSHSERLLLNYDAGIFGPRRRI